MTSVAVAEVKVGDDAEQPRRMRKKAVQQGRSERRGDAYLEPYGEPLSDVRTPLADFFRILLRLLTSRDVLLPWLAVRMDGITMEYQEPDGFRPAGHQNDLRLDLISLN